MEVSALRFEVLGKLSLACLSAPLSAAARAIISPPRLVNRVALRLLPVLVHCYLAVSQIEK